MDRGNILWYEVSEHQAERWNSLCELPTTEAVGFLLHRSELAYPPSLDK